MNEELDGPFGDIYALGSPFDGDTLAIGGDEAGLRALLFRLLQEPGANRDVLRRLAFQDPLGPGLDVDDASLVERLVHHVANGRLAITGHRPAVGGGAARGTGDGAIDAAAAAADAATAPQKETDTTPKIRDWRLECEHHVSKGRNLIEKGTRIEVVPNIRTLNDKVLVHWRDDYLGAMPPTLEVATAGKPASTAPQGRASGMYTTYALDAKYLGDVDIKAFFLPSFWQAFKETTTYTIKPGPASISVVVYNPRQFELSFKLPPMAGFKDGSKYEAQGTQQIRAAVQTRTLKETLTTEDAYWKPSSITLDTRRTSSSPGPDFEPSKSEMKITDTLTFKRDGTAVDLDVLKLVGSILKYADTLREIIKMVKDYAPKVGWYIDWNLQLMQGGATVKWNWKEHTDHRVFQFIDFKISLTLFSLTFEIGIGVSACSFKLQIYASLGGEVTAEAGAQRDSPDGGPGVTLPTLKGKVTGTLGARLEGGYLFKFNAKGETAIETEATLGINHRGKMLGGDLRARWTGIKCTATVSAGLLGVSWNEERTFDLVPPGPWWGLSFPADEPYQPPTMSEAAISNVLKGVLERGWDVLVYSDDERTRYTHGAVANHIAGFVARHPTFDQTPKNVDLLANAIRLDLDRLGVRSWERDWVSLSQLRGYCAGGLQRWLEAAASPTKKLIAANA